MVIDADGNLYGTASSGGISNDGTVFELQKGSNTITALASFNGGNGSTPQAGLTIDAGGNLYGTTSSGYGGNGTVFEVPAGGNAIVTLAVLNGVGQSSVTLDSTGNIYGTTIFGGKNGTGEVFEIAKGNFAPIDLADFPPTPNNGSPGRIISNAGVVLDSSGNLYGVIASDGGGYGEVYEVVPGSGQIKALAPFNDARNVGFDDNWTLAIDSIGNLYGATSTNAAFNSGAVFELKKGSSTITALVSLPFGTSVQGGLIADANGNLFGTAKGGGFTSGTGGVFEVAKQGNAYSVVATFSGAMMGASATGIARLCWQPLWNGRRWQQR